MCSTFMPWAGKTEFNNVWWWNCLYPHYHFRPQSRYPPHLLMLIHSHLDYIFWRCWCMDGGINGAAEVNKRIHPIVFVWSMSKAIHYCARNTFVRNQDMGKFAFILNSELRENKMSVFSKYHKPWMTWVTICNEALVGDTLLGLLYLHRYPFLKWL